MPDIKYQSEDFPPGDPLLIGVRNLAATWDDLLWAALTVGRPSLLHVFPHGQASFYEALFRLSLVRMALEQHGQRPIRFRRTPAAQNLDPSEKGAVNYFLGMSVCKLFATELMDTPWLLHFDVFRALLNPQLLSGRSRPDLVGQSVNGQWHSFESKGRAYPPTNDEKDKAKDQAERCTAINGIPTTCHVGCITYFKKDDLHFFWRDPRPDQEGSANSFNLDVDDRMWRHYYAPALALAESDAGLARSVKPKQAIEPVAAPDIKVEIQADVVRRLRESQWGEAKRWCLSNSSRLASDGFRPDGIRVVAGPTWTRPFSEFE